MSDNLKKINANIASIKRRSGALRATIAETAVMVIEHAKEHGNCTPALRLVEAVPMASERVKLVQWFTAFSPINVTWNADVTKRRVGLRLPDAKLFNEYNLDGAKANPYYDYGKSDDDQTADLLGAGDVNDMISKLVKRLRGRLERGEVAANDREAIAAKVTALQSVQTVTAAAA